MSIIFVTAIAKYRPLQRTPEYIYLWLAYHVIFIMSFIARGRSFFKGFSQEESGIVVHTPLYYRSAKLFVWLGLSLIVYLVCIKWILGWRIYNWWLEAGLVFITFCLGHIVFIVTPATAYSDKYSRCRAPYIAFSALYIGSFYVRFIISILSGFSYNAGASEAILPDVRYNDLPLPKNYYLAYSRSKNIVIVKKVFIFSKDVANVHRFEHCFCDYDIYQFSDHGRDPAEDPFPYNTRAGDIVQLQLNQRYHNKGYINFYINAKGQLEMTAYKSQIAPSMLTLEYVPCGTCTIK